MGGAGGMDGGRGSLPPSSMGGGGGGMGSAPVGTGTIAQLRAAQQQQQQGGLPGPGMGFGPGPGNTSGGMGMGMGGSAGAMGGGGMGDDRLGMGGGATGGAGKSAVGLRADTLDLDASRVYERLLLDANAAHNQKLALAQALLQVGSGGLWKAVGVCAAYGRGDMSMEPVGDCAAGSGQGVDRVACTFSAIKTSKLTESCPHECARPTQVGDFAHASALLGRLAALGVPPAAWPPLGAALCEVVAKELEPVFEACVPSRPGSFAARSVLDVATAIHAAGQGQVAQGGSAALAAALPAGMKPGPPASPRALEALTALGPFLSRDVRLLTKVRLRFGDAEALAWLHMSQGFKGSDQGVLPGV